MRGVIFLILVLFALTVVWRYVFDTDGRALVKRVLRENVWLLLLIAVAVLITLYMGWLFALNGPAIKFL